MSGFKNVCLLPLRFILALVVYFLVLFGLLVSYIFRDGGDGGGSSESEEKEISIPEIELRSIFKEEEKPEVFFRFKFPTYQEVREESDTDVVPGSKHEFITTSGNNSISVIVDEPETSPVNEINREDEKGFSDGNGADVFAENGNGVLELDVQEKQEIWTMDFTDTSEKVQEEEEEEEQIQGHYEFLGESSPVTTDFNSNSDSDSDSSSFENMNLMSHEFDANEMEPVHNQDNVIEDYEDVRPSRDPLDEDEIELEPLWEHQELVEQLKIELKKVRATGLPTILEESESPKITDDLKPWKIDEFQRQDSLGELHKFYKSYRERMRKFDIINYQKMYTMGVLQLRDPLQFMSEQKVTSLKLKSLLQQKLPVFQNKIHDSDPMKKFIQELQADLEVVYVAQMCLSWEFLQWQYDKVLDLWDADPRGIRRYNEVSGEFQQFQVLLQRFVEDEPFQDRPRIQNYVRTRAEIRNLLQVPVAREDKRRGKKKVRQNINNDEYVITSDMLVEIVEESIRIFWRFVRADKDSTAAAHKKMPEVSNPEDLKFLSETRKTLLKKDRKLKDLLRSENCLLKKFRQCREDDTDHVLYFFAQVDIKLVCRVMNMGKLTRDQLIWCHKKLDRIGFVDRKIFVEPAFLLFPG